MKKLPIKSVSRIATGTGLVLLALVFAISNTIGTATVSADIPYINSRVNVSSDGTEANAPVNSPIISISKDGQYVVFGSSATNLVSGDTNGEQDVFVRDRISDTTTLVSVSSSGVQGNDNSFAPKISPNGRYVIFNSGATNLTTPAGASSYYDLFLRDLQNNTTELVSLTNTGGAINSHIEHTAVSADGRFVAFTTAASNVVMGDTNGTTDLFVRDRVLETTTLLSKSEGGAVGNGYASGAISMSCDGALIAFSSTATNLVSGDTNGKHDIFLVNRVGGHTISNITIDGNDGSSKPTVSCDGSSVSFESRATNLVSGDTNGSIDLFVYDVAGSDIERASVSSAGGEANAGIPNGAYHSISGDGRHVSFASGSTNLVSGDTNNKRDIFIRDIVDGVTKRISMRDASTQTASDSWYAYVSANGGAVAYVSADSGLVAGDTNGVNDLFVSETGLDACSIQ